MAEATFETPSNRFFCHECNREVQPNIPAYTCSRCNSGFIEEVERPSPVPPQPASRLNDPAAQFHEIWQTLIPDTMRPVAPRLHRYHTRQAARAGAQDSTERDEMVGVEPRAMFHIHHNGEPGPQSFHGMLNFVLQRIGTDLGRGGQLILHGNPGDYAWGAGGLDTVISQLLTHLEGTGAPPAQKEKIENLARVSIDQSHVDASLQCSICMDDFELGMEVRKLPCDHMYHNDCIVKWLEMHGTCPVCRKDLNGEDTSSRDSGEFSPFFPPPSGGDGASSSSSSSSSMGPSTSSSSTFSM